MASEAQQGELLEWIRNATGQLARDVLHVITTPHMVKITSRTLKIKLNKGRCHQMDHSLPLPFSISPVASQQKMHLGENALCEISHRYGQNQGMLPCGHVVFAGFLTETMTIHHCQDQTLIRCLTEVSNKKLILCSDAGMTWQLHRTKGTHAASSGLILRQHPCAGEGSEAALKQLMQKTRFYPSSFH